MASSIRSVKSSSSDSDSDDDDMDFLMIVYLYRCSRPDITKTPQRNCPFTGDAYIKFLMEGNPRTIHDMLRMNLNAFRSLVTVLVDGGFLQVKGMRISPEESLGMFLYICGHVQCHRSAADRFQHSTETISRHCKMIMRALCNLATMVIQPPDPNIMHGKIAHRPDLFPWFKDCIGAIDGTMIDASPPSTSQNIYRTRKTTLSQNVLAACDFDMKFTFIHTGWEGSAHDSNILCDSLGRPETGFPLPPSNKYYLVDAGYTNMPGFLAPYRRTPYNHGEFDGVVITRPKQLLNFRHSSLRTTIECTFGALKKRFPILKFMPHYKQSRQGSIVLACCVIHNWLRMFSLDDEWFLEAEDNLSGTTNVYQGNASPNVLEIDMSPAGVAEMERFRDALANSMWAHYNPEQN